MVKQKKHLSGDQTSQNRWLRKQQVAARYGVCARTIDRAVANGKFPAPKFPLGDTPFWDRVDLDAHDENIAARPPPKEQQFEAAAASDRRLA
jgi:hypothetical protein